MRILVLSDIHANIDALTAIEEPHDAILFLGDVVDYGPDPAACIDFLRQAGAMRLRGNHDNAVAFRMECGCGELYLHLSRATREFTWQVLDEERLSWLGSAETSLSLDSGDRRVFAVHAAPSDQLFKYLIPETPDEELAREAEIAGTDIILMGHTHRPFIREVGGTLMVNVGSVGQPRDGIPEASYAVLEDGRIELKRARYDLPAVMDKLRALPLEPKVIEELTFILERAGMP